MRRLWTRRKSALLAGMAAAAFLVGAGVVARLVLAEKAATVRISAGLRDGGETLRWMSLNGEIPGASLRVVPVDTAGTIDMLERVDRGDLDFAFIMGGFSLDRFANVRQVAGLKVIPLTLLVKGDLAEAVMADLGALRSRSVNLGSGRRTATYWLSRELLAFAGLAPGQYRATERTLDQLLGEDDPGKLPDAIFLVTAPPSPLVRHLAAGLRYRMVPLPYGDAFRSLALDQAAEARGEGMVVTKEHIPDAAIPAFSYGVSPAIPPREVATIGSRLLLITHRRTRPSVAIRVLETLLDSRWAKAVQPPLDKGVVNLPPEAPWHPGAIEFRDRDLPLITGDSVSFLSNTLQILIPFGGGLWFLRGWLRDRAAAGREQHFDRFFGLVSEVERRGLASGQDGALDREAIERLDLELVAIKDRALGQVGGAGADPGSLAAILMAHISDVRIAFTEARRRALSRREGRAAGEPSPDP